MFDKKAYIKAWRLANPERVKAHNKAYRLAYPKYMKVWYLVHREQVNARSRVWALAHPKETKAIGRAWYLSHPEQAQAHNKAYKQTPKGKESEQRRYASKRQFGFIPLNDWFEGSHGHHIDMERVVYIPEELHKSIWHSVTKSLNLEAINNMAFEFLASQNITEG